MRSNAWCDTTVDWYKPDVNTTIKLDSNLKKFLNQWSLGYDINGTPTISYNKPPEYDKKEETNMKEIKNQQIVDLYYSKKVKALHDKVKEECKQLEAVDTHKSFIEDLKKQFDKHVEKHNIEFTKSPLAELKFDVKIPCTPECLASQEEIRKVCMDEVEKVHTEKAEVLAMLSGCDTYEQEMAVLRSYGIVSDKTVKMMEID